MLAEQSRLLSVGLISGTVLAFPLNSRQDVACTPPPEPQKPVNHMAMSRQEKQFAIAHDDLVLADPCPVIHRPTHTIITQIPGSLISLEITDSSTARPAGIQSFRTALGPKGFLWKVTEADLLLGKQPQGAAGWQWIR